MVRQVTTVNVDWILTEKGKDFGGFFTFFSVTHYSCVIKLGGQNNNHLICLKL